MRAEIYEMSAFEREEKILKFSEKRRLRSLLTVLLLSSIRYQDLAIDQLL